MSTARVILVTVAGPAGQMDVGVRSDATPAELAASLGDMLGVGPARPVAEHRSPPRPGSRLGERALLSPATSLATAGVADGDLLLFRRPDEVPGGPAPLPENMRDPLPASHPGSAQPGSMYGARPGQHQAAPPPHATTAAQPAAAPRGTTAALASSAAAPHPAAGQATWAAPPAPAGPAAPTAPATRAPGPALPRHARGADPGAGVSEDETRPDDRH